MGMSLDTSEVRALAARVGTSGPRIGARAAIALRKTAFDIEADGKMLIEAYDAVDTGDMLNSVSTTITGDGRTGAMTAEVGPTVDYAIYVHEGTSVMPGRPFMGDAFDRRAPGFNEALAILAVEEIL